MLSDVDIIRELKQGRLKISPYKATLLQPASIDIRLNDTFRVFNNSKYTHIDPAKQQTDLTELVVTNGEPFILHPNEFVLAASLEKFTLPNDLSARLEGKSSLGRLGLVTHSTAGFIDPGFSGTVTLELSNVATLPIQLHPGMKIGQVAFFRLESPAAVPYGSPGLGSHYQNQIYPEPSQSWVGFDVSLK